MLEHREGQNIRTRNARTTERSKYENTELGTSEWSEDEISESLEHRNGRNMRTGSVERQNAGADYWFFVKRVI
ncbi:hypothetical protein A8L34_25625 [Bacillus sp. FJAT-27264]|nr:hypothetical protein A8L34_25625 [Bacillus sp. FJAT-27264]